MAFVHGKNTVVKLGSDDLSAYTSSTVWNNSAATHQVTTYGKTANVYAGGLTDGKITIGGTYDGTTLGPRAKIKSKLATTTTFTFQPEGTGTGKPQSLATVVVASYNESSPVADMVTWTAELQPSDSITDSTQA